MPGELLDALLFRDRQLHFDTAQGLCVLAGDQNVVGEEPPVRGDVELGDFRWRDQRLPAAGENCAGDDQERREGCSRSTGHAFSFLVGCGELREEAVRALRAG